MSNRELTECELNGVAAGHHHHHLNNGQVVMLRAINPVPQQHPGNHPPTDPWGWLRKFMG